MLTVIIPAHNEETTISDVVSGIREEIKRLKIQEFEIVVVDNASSDGTAQNASNAGAKVIYEPLLGYGSACLAALKRSSITQGLICFMDGDGADDPADLDALLTPLRLHKADMVLGSRLLGQQRGWVEDGALTTVQRFGNWLTALLLRKTWRVPMTDLGPFRALTYEAMVRLKMDDTNFGWTVQMQARAARLGLRTVEVPVHYRRRQGGRSKISGTLKGSVLAGSIILKTYVQTFLGSRCLK